ncbi:tRNA pseudouridine synthase A [Microbacterium sp. ARD31]|uniref:tRNA pseudouridine synthase A n=1 Tax=Microbacterium sp. ARD31 TaxID=2962576 RepID=UPI002881C1F7|nr:tRNA pseudouridine synthase A [Microbacterium sp. ARD31]MDT0185134.1 tRNA pseudouridine synthase A [Microbacterium sp. ARD31]
MRIRLDIAYDGTHFRGWARQPGLRTVQGTLEDAVARILGGEPRLVVAGRTDAGVHASDQVAHLDLDADQQLRLLNVRGRRAADHNSCTPAATAGPDAARTAESRGGGAAGPDPAAGVVIHPAPGTAPAPATEAAQPAAALAARMTGVLGQYADVAVVRSALAPAGFDARFSAVWRRYAYRIADRESGYDPLERHRTTTVRSLLDVAAMDAAARSLIGLHDFAAYCKPRPEATTIRTLLEFDWRREADGVLVANVKADAFCHSMVRALVGACVAVGEGRLSVADVAEIRDEAERVPEVKVLAARGLTLTEVGYPADELLAQRAEQTRARRDGDAGGDAGTGAADPGPGAADRAFDPTRARRDRDGDRDGA